MSMPKAMLCFLDSHNLKVAEPSLNFEQALRASGFATADLNWKELQQQRGWMQLLPLLDESDLQAWVFIGSAADISPELCFQISMLNLALQRKHPPVTAFILDDPEKLSENLSENLPELPELMQHILIFKKSDLFAGKLVAARFKTAPLPRPFHLVAHVDPYIGEWLELGPEQGKTWNGFMFGVTKGEVSSFGVGKRGIIPNKSTLEYPMQGIKGTRDGEEFNACAAKNTISAEDSCFFKLNGTAQSFFICDYPAQQNTEASGAASGSGASGSGSTEDLEPVVDEGDTEATVVYLY